MYWDEKGRRERRGKGCRRRVGRKWPDFACRRGSNSGVEVASPLALVQLAIIVTCLISFHLLFVAVYILKTPNFVGTGSFFPPNAAIKPNPSTRLVWLGGITPSS